MAGRDEALNERPSRDIPLRVQALAITDLLIRAAPGRHLGNGRIAGFRMARDEARGVLPYEA